MKQVVSTATLLSMLALGAAWNQPVKAQALDADPQDELTIPSKQSFSSGEIETFAVASLNVERIHDEYQTRLQEAADPDEQADLTANAQEQMMQAVEDKGLSVDRYNTIVRAARDDQGLARQIIQIRSQKSAE